MDRNKVTFKDILTVSVEFKKHHERTDVSQWHLNLSHKPSNVIFNSIEGTEAGVLNEVIVSTFHHKLMDFVDGNFFD